MECYSIITASNCALLTVILLLLLLLLVVVVVVLVVVFRVWAVQECVYVCVCVHVRARACACTYLYKDTNQLNRLITAPTMHMHI